jgi:hypothetical protein
MLQNDEINVLKGCGAKTKERLTKYEVSTVEDLKQLTEDK